MNGFVVMQSNLSGCAFIVARRVLSRIGFLWFWFFSIEIFPSFFFSFFFFIPTRWSNGGLHTSLDISQCVSICTGQGWEETHTCCVHRNQVSVCTRKSERKRERGNRYYFSTGSSKMFRENGFETPYRFLAL